jgi:hypothetical protein
MAAVQEGFSEPPGLQTPVRVMVDWGKLRRGAGGMPGAPRRLRPCLRFMVLPGGPFVYFLKFFENPSTIIDVGYKKMPLLFS